MPGVMIKKRDGAKDPWSFDKLVTSIAKAGVPIESAEEIATKVETWARIEFTKKDLASTDVRDKVYEEIKVNFPAEADTYQAFKKG